MIRTSSIVSAYNSIVSDYGRRCHRLRLPRHRQHCRLIKILHPSPSIYGLKVNLCSPLVESIHKHSPGNLFEISSK